MSELDLLKIIHDDVKDIFKILNGNGKEGLVTTVRKNQEFRIESKCRERKLWWTIGGTLVTIISGVILLLVKQIL